MPSTRALPLNLPPRIVDRLMAAAYVGVSPNSFDRMVQSGQMPKPKRLVGIRVGWDVRQLDAAVDRLLDIDGGSMDSNPWDIAAE